MVCIARRESCPQCILKEKCAYSYIFETPRAATAEVKWRASYDPHPFVIEAPLETTREYLPGENLSFNLILIGRGANYFPYFVLAFEELGRLGIGRGKGKFKLVMVEIFGDAGVPGELIYDGETKTLRAVNSVINSAHIAEKVRGLNPSAVTLRFLTPMRIRFGGSFTNDMDFKIFLRSLLRRLSWLSELYCGEKWDLDYAALLSRAGDSVKTSSSHLRWYDWERYSSRQNTRLKMGGFLGRITFEGELAPFLPFIKMGEYLHIGQGTAFGLGKYVMEPANKR
jgi:CRISPR-associated endoribonuclease Cas6